MGGVLGERIEAQTKALRWVGPCIPVIRANLPSVRHRSYTPQLQHICSSDPITSGLTEVNPFACVGKIMKMRREKPVN